MHSTISQKRFKSGQEIWQYVVFLHRCITDSAQQTLTHEQQAQLEKMMSRRI